MPYLPPRPTDPTQFPEPSGLDLDTDVRMIEETWVVNYPLIGYKQIDKRVTTVADPDTLSGETGSTKFDVLYGEPVDPSRTTWRQAHGTAGAQPAADLEVYKDEVRVNWRLLPVNEGSPDLKKYGFDNDDRRVGQVLASVPVSLLDKLGVIATPGDLLLWERDEFIVLKTRLSGYWKNTNVRLYMNILCDHRRHGS